MLISCPSCHAVYDVPEHLLSADEQLLQCARCAHEWLVVPSAMAATDSAPVAVSAPVVSEHFPDEFYPEPADLDPHESPSVMPNLTGRGQAHPPRPPVEPAALAMAWVLTVFVMLSIGWGALRWRGEVMEAWPPSQRAYNMLGLH